MHLIGNSPGDQWNNIGHLITTAVFVVLRIKELFVRRDVSSRSPLTEGFCIGSLFQGISQLGSLLECIRHVGKDEGLGVSFVVDSLWRGPVAKIPAAAEFLLQVVVRLALGQFKPFLDRRIITSHQ